MIYKEQIKKAILIRRVEETLLELFSKGLMNGTVHTCLGQELNAVAISEFLLKDDFVLSNHRGHGHYLSKTNDIKGLFAEVMGKTTGCSGGIGGSQHLFGHHFFSNGIQGGMTPIAAGIAYAQKIKNTSNIAIIFIGDGTFGEGILYETLNICSKWQLPVLFVVENNGISQSTSISQTMAGNIKNRANAFDIEYFNTYTNDIEDLFQTTKKAIESTRNNYQPVILEIKSNRLYSHSKGDDNRDEDFVKSLKNNDFLINFEKEHSNTYDSLLIEINQLIEKELNDAMLDEVLSDFPNQKGYLLENVEYSLLDVQNNKRGNELIYDGLKEMFTSSSDFIMLGEDIETSNEYNPGEYGGAFKVSKDLSILFKERIKNTPISEAAITGIGTGLALAGMKPIIEIMFGDFSTLIFDQLIQHACKFRLMFNNQINVPLIIRTPMGGGRGYGPTHSQCIEKHFMGITDLTIIALNHRIDPSLIYANVLSKIENPHLVIENKLVYTYKTNAIKIPNFSVLKSNESFPSILITNEDIPDCTILCYGGVLKHVEDVLPLLYEKEEIVCDVLCPMIISPINIKPIIDAVQKTKKLLIIEEGTTISAWGSEVIALLVEHHIQLDKVIRIGNNTIIPCSGKAESNLLPNYESIKKTIISLIS